MLPSSEDKKNLIESMKKLTHHISNNAVRQKEIFDSLTRHDLLKIITNLTDENEYLRRISGLFLAELFYNNDDVKLRATKLLDIYPSEGRICLNQIPQQIQKYPSTFKSNLFPYSLECIELMKSGLRENEEDKFCWTINLDRKVLQIEFFDFKKYSSFTFLDPNRNIFGFTHVSKKRKEEIKREVKVESTSKEKSIRSIDSRGGSSRKEGSNIGSTFYKNYLEFRQRKGDSPSSSYRENYEKRDFNKPNISQNHKNNYMANSNNKVITSNIGSSSRKEQPSSYIMTPTKKDYREYINSNKMNNSMHDSLDIGSNMRSPVGSAYRETIYRETLTDRKYEIGQKNSRLNESEIFGSANERNKFNIDSTKNSISQQDKYYKRVKEMLKR